MNRKTKEKLSRRTPPQGGISSTVLTHTDVAVVSAGRLRAGASFKTVAEKPPIVFVDLEADRPHIYSKGLFISIMGYDICVK
jgi:hypothetical protein